MNLAIKSPSIILIIHIHFARIILELNSDKTSIKFLPRNTLELGVKGCSEIIVNYSQNIWKEFYE